MMSLPRQSFEKGEEMYTESTHLLHPSERGGVIDNHSDKDDNHTAFYSSPSMCSFFLRKKSVFYSFLVLSISIALMLSYWNKMDNLKSVFFTPSTGFGVEEDDSSIAITLLTPGYSELAVLNYVPWDVVAEPYKNQLLSVHHFTDETGSEISIDEIDETLYTITWNINGETYTGKEITFRLELAPQILWQCSVTVSRNDVVIANRDFSMAIKYVRREIRSLNDDDRNLFLKTLRLMYDVSTEDGQALYGDKYISAEGLLFRHLNGAGRSDCDHWHDGAGIVVQHMAFTLLTEQSLQAVDKSLSMPYWEYAMDESLYSNWFDSDMFRDDWFGAASPTSNDHSIERGLWAGVKLPDGSAYKDKWNIPKTGSLNPFVNGYGVMRSPWNNNPSPYIGRHNLTYGITTTKMPNCAVMSSCYGSKSLSGITDCLNGVTHGPVHILIGGNWGEGNVFIENRDISFLQGMNKLLFFKNLWRSGFARCPTSCDSSSSNDGSNNNQCACTIPEEYITTYGAQGILERAGVWDQISPSLQKGDSSEETILAALHALADPAQVGEMFSSAAPYDPIFWPVHGQIERVLSLKRVRLAQGYLSSKTFAESWGFAAKDKRYLAGRCDWSDVSSVDDLTLPSCTFHVSNTSCYGHGQNDILDFSNFLGRGETYTNNEFYEFMHPWNEELPYTYDTFDFDYCADQGVDITDADTLLGKTMSPTKTLMTSGRPGAVSAEKIVTDAPPMDGSSALGFPPPFPPGSPVTHSN